MVRTVALKTGQVDVINRPDRKTAHLLGRAPKLQLVNVPGGLLYTFPMLCDTPPYDNVDVRLALIFYRIKILGLKLHVWNIRTLDIQPFKCQVFPYENPADISVFSRNPGA